ncbi:hypothetical protein F4818DRAFT_52937 [Hypoxylon cercidicola]|nr:hypothetical protein F4818DRAFT_52937 [Hypoxylon cercidicola]
MDDAQEALRAHQHRGSAQHEHDLLHTSVLAYARPSPPASTAQLPYPVIIPQRRPKNRDRGFIRAYAPDLMRCGIDQRTFMDFLDGFNKATATSPWLSVIDLAGNAVGLIPYAIAAPIGLAVQIAAGVYKETQGRKHQNDFIVRMNEELFRPRGLYCLIMAYRPDSGKNSTRQGTVTQLDINATGTQANRNNRYRSNDGTMGPIEFPASAELIFPDLENASRDDKEGEGSIGDTVLKAFERFNDRRDLKSQRKYLKKNPTSALSPLMDPKVELTPKDREKQERRLEKNERKQEKHERKREKRAQKHPERVEKGSRKRLLQKDVLYMMIINMPTTDKMENAFQLVGDGKGTSGEDIDTREL